MSYDPFVLYSMRKLIIRRNNKYARLKCTIYSDPEEIHFMCCGSPLRVTQTTTMMMTLIMCLTENMIRGLLSNGVSSCVIGR